MNRTDELAPPKTDLQRLEPVAAVERTHGQSHQAAVRDLGDASSERQQYEGQWTPASPLLGHALSMTGPSRIGRLKSTHRSRRRLSRRATGLPRIWSFVDNAEKVTRSDSGLSQVTIADQG